MHELYSKRWEFGIDDGLISKSCREHRIHTGEIGREDRPCLSLLDFYYVQKPDAKLNLFPAGPELFSSFILCKQIEREMPFGHHPIPYSHCSGAGPAGRFQRHCY